MKAEEMFKNSIRIFGYDRERGEEETVFLPDYDPVCMVIRITRGNKKEIEKEIGIPVKRNEFLLSTGNCVDGVKTYGPFKKLEKAFEKGRNLVGAIRFKGEPEFPD